LKDVSIREVEKFWDENPLFSGESNFDPGTLEFFNDHERVYIEDVFAGHFNKEEYIPKQAAGNRVLDLGCGIGFWSATILESYPAVDLYVADLTRTALDMTKKRLNIMGFDASFSKQNAESMSYDDAFFDHVNCQGVIHHTPNTQACVAEIARVLKSGGTASISVYYRNIFLRNWRFLTPIGKLLNRFGGGLKGRGRQNIFAQTDVDEITKLYDGDKNPLGKSYNKEMILEMVKPYFHVNDVFLNFFPARSLPFKIPHSLHRFLSRKQGFMIHLSLKKS